jgi:3D (Asp-Asp-Asp) domain-containing protein
MIKAFLLATLMSIAYQPEEIPEPLPIPPENAPYAVYEEYASLGNYTVTAYCGCEECCGKWALQREGGTVTGAAGVELVAGYSIAADKTFPFGTRLYIDGKEYEVQDRGGAINGNRIDVYFTTHAEALAFDMGEYEVKIRVSLD